MGKLFDQIRSATAASGDDKVLISTRWIASE
jgi:hypothetical protein